MLELRDYQEQTLEVLERYLSAVAKHGSTQAESTRPNQG